MAQHRLENLPIEKILEFFQTKKIIKTNEDTNNHQFNQLVARRRKLLINGSGIKTDLRSILNFSATNKYFNQFINKSNFGKLVLTVYHNSKELETSGINLQHISYCPEFDCKNICHYVNKDIKHSNILKKIALDKFNELKKNSKFKEDIIPLFKVFLNSKQIESYYRIKKMDKKLKEYKRQENEKTKSCKSSELDPISLDTDTTDTDTDTDTDTGS